VLNIVQNTPAKITLSKTVPSPMQALRMAQWNFLELLPHDCLTKPVVSGQAGARFHMVMDPPLIRDMLNARVDDFPKGDMIVDLFRSVALKNIVSAHGATWEKLRPPMAKAIHISALREFSATFSEAAEATSARIAKISGSVDIESQMTQSTFDVISNLALTDVDADLMETVQRALATFTAEIARFSPLDFLNAPSWMPRIGRTGLSASIGYGHKIVDAVITQRKESGPKSPPDILDKLIETQRSDPFITDAHIRDNLNVMLIAGHDTTARTLSWAFYLSAFAPEVQEAASLEAREVLKGRPAGFDDLADMPLSQQIIKETMRLYPSFPLLVRKSKVSESLHGLEIHKNDQILIPVYALHRNALYWEEPDRFMPSRFDGKTSINKYAYLPFGGGPRICIGASFAQAQAHIQLATLLSRFRFSLIEGRTPQPSLSFSLISRNGIHLNAAPIID